VEQRYGKWRSKLKNKPGELAELNAYGKAALERFGYEPLKVPSRSGGDAGTSYRCEATDTMERRCKVLKDAQKARGKG
jgi:hypothetical protein